MNSTLRKFFQTLGVLESPPEKTLRAQGFPHTYPELTVGQAAGRPQIFEPALLQFPKAFRTGDPPFGNPKDIAAWLHHQRRVMGHLLEIIDRAPWKYHLVLRGSLLLKTWLAEAAREPRDIDWVVVPPTLTRDDPQALRMLDDLIARVCAEPKIEGAEILTETTLEDEIWNYDRSPGRRIVFSWMADDLPPGFLQMDFAFGEALLLPTVRTAIPTLDHRSVNLQTANLELSLAWKVYWLLADQYPQGKDLYDATILAEQVRLPSDLLRQVFELADEPLPKLSAEVLSQKCIDWKNFQLEYPWISGQREAWEHRLVQALGWPDTDPGGGLKPRSGDRR